MLIIYHVKISSKSFNRLINNVIYQNFIGIENDY